jgi:signal peptidase II
MGPSVEGPGSERKPPSSVYRDLILIQLAALVFLSDQFTKFLVREFLLYRESFPVAGFFRFTHTHNTGSAFGLFQGQNTILILVAIVGIAILALIYRSQRPPSSLLRFSIGLQMGGAAGNLIDRLCVLQADCHGNILARLQQGYVIDFLDVGAWPVFNLADSAIVVGLALLAWMFLKPRPQSATTPATEVLPVETPVETPAAGSSGQMATPFSSSGFGVDEPGSLTIPFAMGEAEDSSALSQTDETRVDDPPRLSTEDHPQ